MFERLIFALLALGAFMGAMAVATVVGTFSAAHGAATLPIVAIGDSIACGLYDAGADGGPDVCKVGASPTKVLEIIKAIACNELAGRVVVLSSGATNSGDTRNVAEELAAVRACNPAEVVLLGADPALGLNDALFNVAHVFPGVQLVWLTGIDKDNPHHPKSYKALLAKINKAVEAPQTAANPAKPAESAKVATVRAVPAAAVPYQRTLIREARATMGLTAPVAMFAAQIQTESNWRTAVCSGVGACGLAQFIPGTARQISEKYRDLAEDAPYNPAWAIRALVRYDHDIYTGRYVNAVQPATACDGWAFALSGYNGGEGWISRDRELARRAGRDVRRWWLNVELYSSRSAANKAQNRAYPRLILQQRQQLYASWGAGVEGAPCRS